MSWEFAMAYAARRARETGVRWYVRGYWTETRGWRYGAYMRPPTYESLRR